MGCHHQNPLAAHYIEVEPAEELVEVFSAVELEHCIVAAVSYLYLIFCRLYLLENQYCFCYSQREVILQSTLWDKKKEEFLFSRHYI